MRPVKTPPFRVKQPVLRHAEVGVVQQLPCFVGMGGAFRSNFQHEVGRLAVFRNGITPLPDDRRAVNIKSDEQVGNAQPGAPAGQTPAYGGFADDDGGALGAQMPAQGGLVGRFVQYDRVVQIVPGQKVREMGNRRRGNGDGRRRNRSDRHSIPHQVSDRASPCIIPCGTIPGAAIWW